MTHQFLFLETGDVHVIITTNTQWIAISPVCFLQVLQPKKDERMSTLKRDHLNKEMNHLATIGDMLVFRGVDVVFKNQRVMIDYCIFNVAYQPIIATYRYTCCSV